MDSDVRDFLFQIFDAHGIIGEGPNGALVFSPEARSLKITQIYEIIAEHIENTQDEIDSPSLLRAINRWQREQKEFKSEVQEALIALYELKAEEMRSKSGKKDIYEIFYTMKYNGLEPYLGKLMPHDPKILIYNKVEDIIIKGVEFSIDDILEDIGISRAKLKNPITRSKYREVIPIFDPNMSSRFSRKYIPERSEYLDILNLHNPPAWRKLCPERIKKLPLERAKFYFFLNEHLFCEANELDYGYCWQQMSIKSRCQNYMVLNGMKGCGKTAWALTQRQLVSPEYFEIGSGATVGRFNGKLLNKRHVNFDEVGAKSTEKGVDGLKAIANSRIHVEQKGKEAVTIQNYCSFSITLNYEGELGIKPDERRFSIPKLSDKTLPQAMLESGQFGDDPLVIDKIISDHMRFLEGDNPTEEEIETFAIYGYFILNYETKYNNDPIRPLKGDAFYASCSLQLEQYEREILSWIPDNAEPDRPIPLRKIKGNGFELPEGSKYSKLDEWCLAAQIPEFNKRKNQSYFPTKKLERWLQSYFHKSKTQIGRLVLMKHYYKEGLRPDEMEMQALLVYPEAIELLKEDAKKAREKDKGLESVIVESEIDDADLL